MVKICGLTKPEQAREIDSMGVDYIGVILDPQANTPRKVSLDVARNIVSSISNAEPVGVLVGVNEGMIRGVGELGFRYVQLHVRLPPRDAEEINELALGLGMRIIAVVPVGPLERDLMDYANFMADLDSVDYVLFDAEKSSRYKDPSGLRIPLGQLAELLRRHGSMKLRSKLGIAGGINPGNVRHALSIDPVLIDVSSGVESQPGIKDLDKVRRLLIEVGR